VERQVPGGEPRVLPLVRHREHIVRGEVAPPPVAPAAPSGVDRLVRVVAGEPLGHVEPVVLTVPEEPGQRLPLDVPPLRVEPGGRDRVVEGVRLASSLLDGRFEGGAEPVLGGGRLLSPAGAFGVEPQSDDPFGIERAAAGRPLIREAQADRPAPPGGDVHAIVRGGLGAAPLRVGGAGLAVHDVPVEGVLDVRLRVRAGVKPLLVRLVLREEELRLPLAIEPAVAELRMCRVDAPLRSGIETPEDRLERPGVPGPRVPEPEGGEEVQPGRLRPAVVGGQPDQDLLRPPLCVLHDDVVVPVVVEHAGVEQFILEVGAGPTPVLRHEELVREGALGVLVQKLEIGAGGCGVEVEVVLLDVLPVVPLGIGQPEEPLLEDHVGLVPEGDGETEALLVVGEAGEAVLPPSIGAKAGVVVREAAPGVVRRTVVFAHRAPLAVGQIRPPAPPRDAARLVQPRLLRIGPVQVFLPGRAPR